MSPVPPARRARIAFAAAVAAALWVRWLQLAGTGGPTGYDAWGHVSYVLFLDLYGAVPRAGQGQSSFHPPLHYALGWLLARAGSALVLVRGMAAISSLASLGTALLATWLVRRTWPARPWLPVLAFSAVAFWPPQLYSSPMPGNEVLCAFLGSAAVAVFALGEGRERRRLARDVGCGVLAGLALLAKFSGLLALLAVLGSLVAAQLRRGAGTDAGVLLGRVSAVAGPALLLALPFYARNQIEFGNPFELSRGYPCCAGVEAQQPPGERGLADFLSFPPSLFADPRPRTEPLLRSVWGSVYVRMWAERVTVPELRVALVAMGAIPTALALFGALGSLGALRRRHSSVDLVMLLLAAGNLAALAIFAWRVPIFSALKASYLMGASLPWGFFIVRGVTAPPLRANRALRVAASLGVGAAALLAAGVYLPGVATPEPAEAARMATLHAHFGDFARARQLYRDELRRLDEPEVARIARAMGWPISRREGLAAVELLAGDPAAALALYREALALPRPDSPLLPSRAQQLSAAGAAAALAGERELARQLLDEAVAAERAPEPLANRGALRAVSGDLDGALADLRAALELAPELAAAHASRAFALERRGDVEGAAAARAAAARAAARAPRGHPYGVGDGLRAGSLRFLLRVRGGELVLAEPFDRFAGGPA